MLLLALAGLGVGSAVAEPLTKYTVMYGDAPAASATFAASATPGPTPPVPPVPSTNVPPEKFRMEMFKMQDVTGCTTANAMRVWFAPNFVKKGDWCVLESADRLEEGAFDCRAREDGTLALFGFSEGCL